MGKRTFAFWRTTGRGLVTLACRPAILVLILAATAVLEGFNTLRGYDWQRVATSFGEAVARDPAASRTLSVEFWLGVTPALLVGLVVMPFALGAALKLADPSRPNGLTLRDALAHARDRYWAILSVCVLPMLVAIPAAVSAYADMWLWAVLHVLQTWLVTRLTFLPQQVVLGPRNDWGALATAWRLTKGCWWRSYWLVALPMLFGVAGTLVLHFRSSPWALAPTVLAGACGAVVSTIAYRDLAPAPPTEQHCRAGFLSLRRSLFQGRGVRTPGRHRAFASAAGVSARPSLSS